jgi:hypothetical protein
MVELALFGSCSTEIIFSQLIFLISNKWQYNFFFFQGFMRSSLMNARTPGTSTVHATEIGLKPDQGLAEFHLHQKMNNL